MNNKRTRGFTLVELVIAVGLFALIMVLVSGAYLTMISVTRQTQGVTAGIDNLSFALETMVRTIRTNRHYGCPSEGSDCAGAELFTVKDSIANTITYTIDHSQGAITQTTTTGTVNLTDTSITVSSLKFYATGTARYPADRTQAHVTIIATGSISSGPGKSISFTVETSATMRGTDL